jgi:hypothetical protein
MARDEGWQGGSVTPAEHGGWADKGMLRFERESIVADNQSLDPPRDPSTRVSTPSQLPLLPSTSRTSRRNG